MQHERTLTPTQAGNIYGKFTPSPVVKVIFPGINGSVTKVIPMNRKTRRAARIKEVK